MPKRKDIQKILIIGSGPIVIGQACEFDYSGVQACKALREEGYEIVLINSNPATIMTDPEIAHSTYIEPIELSIVTQIIKKERPDALLPTLGGQTALNMAMQLSESGILQKYNVEMIGVNVQSIRKAEDRELFQKSMRKIGLDVTKSFFVYNLEEALQAVQQLSFPCVVRPSYTLGGLGGGIAYNLDEFKKIASLGLESSRINEISVEESIIGWKEYELEVVRDSADNVVIICGIENLDPIGIHTGDSITVAPTQTLRDVDYQRMRDASIAIIREIGVETGGSNIQFALHAETGRLIVIEMNPRVSRSSALASKATGYPIAKIASKLAVGYTLDELKNDITQDISASFEPTLDYIVVKIPRFTFEKFPEAGDSLGISMKSIGETMAIGRNFREALQKGLRGLEIGHVGLDNKLDYKKLSFDKILDRLRIPNSSRIFYLKYAFQKGMSIEEVFEYTSIDPWFLFNIKEIVSLENKLVQEYFEKNTLSKQTLQKAKADGFLNVQLANLLGLQESEIESMCKQFQIQPVYKAVDTCSAEFEAYTPYYYSTYEDENEGIVSAKKKVLVLGAGPNRIGQGIEFDYCCCHASFALKEMGYESIMINSNPETVSTDYDTSDRLYFEPLTFEDVMNVVRLEKPEGVIVQFGGQTPLNLAQKLHLAGVKILGTQLSSIEISEDRNEFSKLMTELGILQPKNGIAFSLEEALKESQKISFPLLIRPSYVLGGRAMRIIGSEKELKEFFQEAQEASKEESVLIDEFLVEAIEIDVDALSDGNDCFVAGIMEHIEEVGIHSGDSACVCPSQTLSQSILKQIKIATQSIAKRLKIVGLLNIQFAVKNNLLYIIELNPRASRTVPFVSKVTGNPLVKLATELIMGKKIKDLSLHSAVPKDYIGIKESVFPFSRFSGVDILLGPEMKSTGEVMGIAASYGEAFAKSQLSAGQALPDHGFVLVSVNNRDKQKIIPIIEKLDSFGFQIISTPGTAQIIKKAGIKVRELSGKTQNEDILRLINNAEIQLIINTPSGQKSQSDMNRIRAQALMWNLPLITTLEGAYAAVEGIKHIKQKELTVKNIQSYHSFLK